MFSPRIEGDKMTNGFLDGLFSLRGKVAVVPGGYGGIGESVCRGLARAGAQVVVAGRNAERCHALAEALKTEGHDAVGMPFDAEKVDDIRRMIDAAAAQWKRLDILVNCVGLNREEKALEITEDNFDAVIAGNLKSALFLSQSAAKHMIAGGRGGKQVHLGSVRTLLALRGRGYAAYCAAKGGLSIMCK
ncbi:MAG: alcohol dehydrogenase, partial [Phototrophicales bacterium]